MRFDLVARADLVMGWSASYQDRGWVEHVRLTVRSCCCAYYVDELTLTAEVNPYRYRLHWSDLQEVPEGSAGWEDIR